MSLEEMFEKQRAMQERLGNNIQSQSFINETTLALTEEAFEALRCTNHKAWSKKFGQPLTEEQREQFKGEIIDVWHFLINLTMASGMSAVELNERFFLKNKINKERQDNGY